MSRIIRRRRKKLDCQLHDVKKTVGEYLHLEDDRIVDVLLAAYIGNQVIDSDPIWLLIIGSSSNAKTELLRAFDGLDDVYFLSDLTEKTFISGYKNSTGGKNPSLLFSLKDKVLVFKDFTTVLSMYREKRTAIIAQLREIFDGKFTKAFGTGEEIRWKGKVGFIAACTHAYYKYHSVINTMGERFLTYRIDSKDYLRMGEKAAEMTGKETEMRERLREEFHKFLFQFKNYNEKIGIPLHPEMEDKIIHIAILVATARTAVDRDRSRGNLNYTPHPEGPARLIKQLKTMAIALAIVHGKSTITEPIYKIIKKMACDAVQEIRMEVLKYLWDAGAIQNDENHFSRSAKKWARKSEVAIGIDKPTSTVKMVLEDMTALSIVNRKIEDGARGERGRNIPYLWQISRKTSQSIGKTGFLDE